MPQQLIYTSAPQGLVAGRSGYCTVARSAAMREALMLQLEKLSYYQHSSLSGGPARPIFTCRVLDLRGTRFHVLTRMQDAGLDFTGRTNFVAHHLVFTPEEVRQHATPPMILRDWPGWAKAWTGEPGLLQTEDWRALAGLTTRTAIPAQTWQRVTGDAVNGYALLEARSGASFRVDDVSAETILGLFAETLELLEVRDSRRDFRAAAWQYTFTTSIQEQDNPADFRWRCVQADAPAANRIAALDCRALSSLRAVESTAEEIIFARVGRVPPRFVSEPQDIRIAEGEIAKFQTRAEGVPQPSYQWFAVDREENVKIIAGSNGPELTIQNPPLGKSRYVVRASNSAGEATCSILTLSVEQKLRVASSRTIHNPLTVGSSYTKSEDDIDRQRRRLEAEQAEKAFKNAIRRKRVLISLASLLAFAAIVCGFWLSKSSYKSWLVSLIPRHHPDLEKPSSPGQPPAVVTSSEAPAPEVKYLAPVLLADGGNLPQGWSQMDIGSVANSDKSFSSNVFSLKAAAAGFSSNSDNIYYVYTSNAPTEFEASINPHDGPSHLRVGEGLGIMVRASGQTNSAFAFAGFYSNMVVTMSRSSNSQLRIEDTHLSPAQIKILIVRLTQLNDKIVVRFSTSPSQRSDADDWPKTLNEAALGSDPPLIGFALFSGSTSTRAQASFRLRGKEVNK